MAIYEIKTGKLQATDVVGNTATSNDRQFVIAPLVAGQFGPYSSSQLPLPGGPSITFVAKATAIYKIRIAGSSYVTGGNIYPQIIATAGSPTILAQDQSLNETVWCPFDVETIAQLTAGVQYTFAAALGYGAGTAYMLFTNEQMTAQQITPDASGVAISSKIFLSQLVTNGTRVTTTPAALGEWRSQLRNASATTFTDTNGNPSIAPTINDGIPIWAGNGFGSADTNNNPSQYTFFIGYNKYISVQFYASAGKTDVIDHNPFSLSASSISGEYVFYDPQTGLLTINHPTNGVDSAGYLGRTVSFGNPNSGYFDVAISDNPAGIGIVGYVGQVLEIACEVAPPGTLECGQAVSRTTYARLFGQIGTSFGVGDGSTTFDLPPRGVFYRSWDHGAGNDPDAGARTANNGGASGDHVGSQQADGVGPHGHRVQMNVVAGGVTTSIPASNGAGSIFDPFDPANGRGGTNIGSENRPKNVNVMKVIVY